MIPALYQLARQLYQNLRPELLIQDSGGMAAEKAAGVLLANNLLINFLEQYAAARSKKAQALCIHTTESYCVHLSDLLSEFRLRLLDTRIRGKALSEHLLFYQDLQKSLLALLEQVQSGFGQNSDHRLRVPVCLQEVFRSQYVEQLARLVQNRESGTEYGLTELLSMQLNRYINDPKLTFGTHRYLQQLLQLLLLPEHRGKEAQIKLLIRYNFNDPVWMDQLIHFWVDQRDTLASVEERVSFWRNNQLELARLHPVYDLALHPEQRGCKELLQEALTLEENSNDGLSNQATADRDKPFATSLSVSQLGLFLRLQVDTQILQTNNKNELIRQTASRYRTNRTTQISHENLHKKFYTCDPAAISIMRSHLVNMMNWLKRYG